MLNGNLQAAIDYRDDGTGEYGSFSYTRVGQWYWCNYGPTYGNTYIVLEYDDDGLKLLQSKERKEESC